MRYAIIESGGKQYRAVEGGTLDVDRLSIEPGKKFDLENILLMADGDDVMVGTPTVSEILVKATVLAHVKGPKVITFKYRPEEAHPCEKRTPPPVHTSDGGFHRQTR